MRARLSLVCAIVVFVAAPAAAQVITVTDLAPPGSLNSVANAVNDAGDIVGNGFYAVAPGTRAVVWRNHVASVLDLACPSCTTLANDINNAGDIVGAAFGPFGDVAGKAFLWRNGVTTFLAPLPGDSSATAHSVNELGVVVGVSVGPSAMGPPTNRAVRWVDGVPEWLGTLGGNGPLPEMATAINDLGTIVGNSINANGIVQPFIWQNGVMTGLPLLTNATCSFNNAANGINNAGVIVGTLHAAGCLPMAVKWVNGVIEALPGFTPGNPFGQGWDINESGDVVGSSTSGAPIATLWRNGVAMSLGKLPGAMQSIAADINDSGLIAGRSLFSNNPQVFRANSFFVPPANTPPTLNLASDIVINADSAGGALAFFSVTADDAEDGTVNATCSPSSGSQFAIGTTRVTCQAADTGGLEATGSFTVTVLGAQEQAQAMLQQLGPAGPGRSLQNKIASAIAALQSGNSAAACGTLQGLINEASAQSGKKLTLEQAAAIIADSHRIRAVIGC